VQLINGTLYILMIRYTCQPPTLKLISSFLENDANCSFFHALFMAPIFEPPNL
jgi:hypothetical protein